MKTSNSYLQLINDLKNRIIHSQYQAARLANREQLILYFKVGEILSKKISGEKWGNRVLEQISVDLQKQVPGLKGFSYRNLRNMRQFFEAYEKSVIWQTTTAKLQAKENQGINITKSETIEPAEIFAVSFSHHILLLNKCKREEERFFYMRNAASLFWSIAVLEHNIDGGLFEKQGKLPNNFTKTLPAELKSSAVQLFKDEYLMDYMNLRDNEDEREVENKIVENIRDFILRMGKGFSFIGNQVRIELDGEEFFIDLLFFNRHLQCLIAFELKKGKFKPEYAGQLNFYLNVLDEKVKLKHENSSVGIVLCREKNNTVVEYSIKSIDKAMGVATFKTTKHIPKEIKEVMPNADDLTKLIE